jgi:HSP20 family protein
LQAIFRAERLDARETPLRVRPSDERPGGNLGPTSEQAPARAQRSTPQSRAILVRKGETAMLTTHFLVPRRTASPLAAFGWGDFDRVFDQLWNGSGRNGPATYAPRIDFTENETELRVAAELPGFEEKDLKVTLEDGVLTIEAERNAEVKDEDAKEVRHLETFHGKYRRALRLASEVDAEGVKATYRNGILTVTLPKVPAPQPKTIQITNGS